MKRKEILSLDSGHWTQLVMEYVVAGGHIFRLVKSAAMQSLPAAK